MKTIQTFIGRLSKSPAAPRLESCRSFLITSEDDLPKGIFLGHLVVRKRRLPSLIFAGALENSKKNLAEMLVLDLDTEIQIQQVRLELAQKMREHRMLATELELERQLREDEKIARIYFGM